MARKAGAELSVTAAQAAAFRLARHHLAPRTSHPAPRTSLIDVVRDTGGIQAQVMSAAETALWTRRRETTRDEVKAALFERREIVKTSAMRLTLHLIPAADLPMVIAAMRPSSTTILQRWHARVGAKPDHVRALVNSVLDGLADGPRTQPELIARARKKAGKGMRVWLDHAWAALRPAVIDGLIVYGPMRGAATTFVRVDRWLPAQAPMGVNERARPRPWGVSSASAATRGSHGIPYSSQPSAFSLPEER